MLEYESLYPNYRMDFLIKMNKLLLLTFQTNTNLKVFPINIYKLILE
jgi:hypothetical protein